jgi:hypothetical protein
MMTRQELLSKLMVAANSWEHWQHHATDIRVWLASQTH